MPHHYHLFGLTIASDLELPELLSAPSDVPVDIHVLLEPLSERIDESLRLTHPTFFHPNAISGIRQPRQMEQPLSSSTA